MPRKPASENVGCLCRLLNILANFSNLFLHAGKQCGLWSDCSWSGSKLFAKMTYNHKKMTKQTTIVLIGSLRVNGLLLQSSLIRCWSDIWAQWKKYLRTCTPNEDSSQSVHCAVWCLRCLHNFASLAIQNAPSEDSDQTAQCAVWSESSLGVYVSGYFSIFAIHIRTGL